MVLARFWVLFPRGKSIRGVRGCASPVQASAVKMIPLIIPPVEKSSHQQKSPKISFDFEPFGEKENFEELQQKFRLQSGEYVL